VQAGSDTHVKLKKINIAMMMMMMMMMREKKKKKN
jgi:hypothetical protein